MPEEPASATLERAIAFFRQPVWERLLEALHTRYMLLGRIGGQVVMHDCTPDEKREFARFLNKRQPQEDVFIVRLADFQQALFSSAFACDLPTLLQALYPERSHMTRPARRIQRTHEQQLFAEALDQLVEELPADCRAWRWLLQGAHGREWLFHRYKNEPPAERDTFLCSLRLMASALNQLPTPPAYERIALFARRVSGDPHFLDNNTATGRLFLRALSDLSHLEASSPEEYTTALSVEENPNTEEDQTPDEREQERLLLYYEMGLLQDTLSSTISVCQLAYAEDKQGCSDPLIEHAGARVLVLPLRQLLAWTKLIPATRYVYLIENPQVFEVIADTLIPLAERDGWKMPTLVCTSGWPSLAAIRLLNLFVESVPDCVFRYSGDFDLQGLRIAAYLLARYPHQCHLWHFDPTSYQAALHSREVPLSQRDLAGLYKLPPIFAPLVTAMHEHRQRAYQEGITAHLLKDIQQGC